MNSIYVKNHLSLLVVHSILGTQLSLLHWNYMLHLLVKLEYWTIHRRHWLWHFGIMNNFKINNHSMFTLKLTKLFISCSPHTGPLFGGDDSPSFGGVSGKDRLELSGPTPLYSSQSILSSVRASWGGPSPLQAQRGEWHRKCYCDHEKALVTTHCLQTCHQMAWKSLKLGTVTNASLVMFHFSYLTVPIIIFLSVR